MAAQPEGTASRAGLCVLGLLSVIGFVPVLASSVVVGVQRPASAVHVAGPAAGLTPPEPADHHRLAVAVVEPAPVLPPGPPPPPEPAKKPVVASEDQAPVDASGPTPPAPAVEVAAVLPAEPQSAGLVALGGGLTTAAAPATSALPVPLVDSVPLVEAVPVVGPILGSLLGG